MPRTGRGFRSLLTVLLPHLLTAQSLPPTPVPPPLEAPTPSELLPLRPYQVERGAGLSRVPFDWRGERVREAGDIWVLEEGAIQAEGLLLLADRIEYRIAEGRLVAEGHIRLEGPGLRLRGERLEMNWALRTGEAWALQMDLPPTWTLKSGHVAFHTLRTWAFEEVELSPCMEVQPGWKAKLTSLKVDLDGFATLWNARLLLGPAPILYLPWAIYPAQAERTSGLMEPRLGYSNDLGTTVGLSYFQVLGSSADLTFSPEYLSKEGILWGGEARWRPDLTHQGSVSGLTIDQRSLDTRRYRYSVKEVWQREDGWQVTADVNQASDYLVDSDFGKGLGNLGASSFDSSLYVGRSYTFGSLSLSAADQRGYFSAVNQLDPGFNPAIPTSLRWQTLPQGEFRFFPVPLFESIYLDGGLRAGQFGYRVEGSTTTPDQHYAWDRQDANTRIHGRLGQWGPFRADFEVMGRATHYSSTLSSNIYDPAAGASGTAVDPVTSPYRVDGPAASRFLTSEHLRLSGPQVGRSFKDLSVFGFKGELKHVIEPYFGFTETSPFNEAGRLQRFDEVDSFPGVNQSASGERSFEVGFMQHLLGRSGAGGSFADLARLRIATRYYANPIILSDGRYKQGWSSIDTDLDVEPSERWRLSFRRSSDVGQGGSDNSLSLEIKAHDGGRFSLAYYSTGINQFLVRQQGFQVGGLQRYMEDRLRFQFAANFDFATNHFSSTELILAWVQPCVAYSVKYTHTALDPMAPNAGREDRVYLTLTLRGLGDLFSFQF